MVKTVVNNALGLAQYIAASLTESQSVSYLLAVEGLTIEHWAECKQYLTNVNTTNRQTKERTIEDVVVCLKNGGDGDNKFLVEDLSLLPGLSKIALELITYSKACMHGVAAVLKNSRLNEQDALAREPPSSTTPTATEEGNRVGNEYSQYTHEKRNKAPTDATSPPPSGAWNSDNPAIKKPPSANLGRRKQRAWYQGSNRGINQNLQVPLTSVCLAVKSGCDETEDSLKAELQRWNYRELTAELVSSGAQFTLFRVKFQLPLTMKDTWKDNNAWPSRMLASAWRGNPSSVLNQPEQRKFRKAIYIGNLSPSITLQKVTENVKRIYANEISTNVIEDVETLLNSEGTEYTMNRSVCVILTSHLGKSLHDLPLKLDHYPHSLRRSVRVWRGRPPWPDDHQTVKPKLDLVW